MRVAPTEPKAGRGTLAFGHVGTGCMGTERRDVMAAFPLAGNWSVGDTQRHASGCSGDRRLRPPSLARSGKAGEARARLGTAGSARCDAASLAVVGCSGVRPGMASNQAGFSESSLTAGFYAAPINQQV
jgi:hypothetical protein